MNQDCDSSPKTAPNTIPAAWLVVFAVAVVGLVAWQRTLEGKAVRARSIHTALESEWATRSQQCTEVVNSRRTIEQTLARVKQINETREAPSWAGALGRIAASLPPNLEPHDLHTHSKPDNSTCEITLTGFFRGPEGRMSAHLFWKALTQPSQVEGESRPLKAQFTQLEEISGNESETGTTFTLVVTATGVVVAGPEQPQVTAHR